MLVCTYIDLNGAFFGILNIFNISSSNNLQHNKHIANFDLYLRRMALVFVVLECEKAKDSQGKQSGKRVTYLILLIHEERAFNRWVSAVHSKCSVTFFILVQNCLRHAQRVGNEADCNLVIYVK